MAPRSSSRRPGFIVALFALVLAASAGCALDAEPGALAEDELGDGKADGSPALRAFYRCETAKIHAGTGDTWRYRTSAFNNALASTRVWVTREYAGGIEEFPPIEVDKIGTDTFSDGERITLRLEQKGAGKSITVTHHTLDQVARAASGWCSAFELPSSTGDAPHDFLAGAAGWFNRDWTLVAAGSSLFTLPLPPHVEARFGALARADQRTNGSLEMVLACSPLINSNASSVPGGLALQRVQGLFNLTGLVFAAWSAVQCSLNGGYDEQLLVGSAQVGTAGLPRVPTSFLDGCGRGNDTLYVVTGTQTSTTLLCVRGFESADPRRPDHVRMRAISANNFTTSEWVTAVDLR